MLEKLIKNYIINFLTNHNLITDKQNGFIPGWSCVTSLPETLEDWTDGNEPFDTVDLDLKKVFDNSPCLTYLTR